MQQKLRIALQRSGRLAEGSLNLLKRCGLKIRVTKNQLLTKDDNFGIDVIFARDDDIPGLISRGICDIGIIGQNLLKEYNGHEQPSMNGIQVVMPLGFAQCRLMIAGPKGTNYQSLEAINGKLIATSYPNILTTFLHQHAINAQIITMHGSVELAPQIGIADLICDLVSSGTTLNENGLQEMIHVLSSEAVLIRNSGTFSQLKEQRLARLMLRIRSILNANQNKYIMLHIERSKLPTLVSLLPGSETPTIMELPEMPEKVAVHVVCHEEEFWNMIETLKEIGASSILVLPIEKMII